MLGTVSAFAIVLLTAFSSTSSVQYSHQWEARADAPTTILRPKSDAALGPSSQRRTIEAPAAFDGGATQINNNNNITRVPRVGAANLPFAECAPVWALPINPRTGSSVFNVALTPHPVRPEMIPRLFSKLDHFCVIDHTGRPRLSRAPVSNHGESGSLTCVGDGSGGVTADGGDEVDIPTTYLSKHERWVLERRGETNAKSPAASADEGLYGLESTSARGASTTTSVDDDIYLAVGRWGSSSGETIAYSQMALGYVTIRSRRGLVEYSRWHPLGLLPPSLSSTNTHRLAHFLLTNFAGTEQAPRLGIEDAVVIEARDRFFVFGNIGFGLGHSQPFLGEITSRVIKSSHGAVPLRRKGDVNNSHHCEGVRRDVSTYDDEWLPTVDDPHSFGIRLGEPSKNHPFHTEKNWNVFPCVWRRRAGAQGAGGVYEATSKEPVFDYEIGQHEGGRRLVPLTLCLQRNIAPTVETFAYDIQRRRVVWHWKSAKHRYASGARGGKGVLPVLLSDSHRGGGVNTTNSSPAVPGLMLTLAHNTASHYELSWLLQQRSSPFAVVAMGSPFSLFNEHLLILNKTANTHVADGDSSKKQFGKIVLNKAPSLTRVEFVKSIFVVGGGSHVGFFHSVNDDSSVLCVTEAGSILVALAKQLHWSPPDKLHL